MYKATFIPEGPGSKIVSTGETAEAAVREAYRVWLRKGFDDAGYDADYGISFEKYVDGFMDEVVIRNGCIYDGEEPCGDVGPG